MKKIDGGCSVLNQANDSLGKLSSTIAKAIHTVPAGPTPGQKHTPGSHKERPNG